MPTVNLSGKTLAGHGTATVDDTAAALIGTVMECSSVALKASSSNTDVIWLGSDDTVAEDDGYPLAAGESLVVPVEQLGLVFAISGTAGQSLHYLVASR